VSPTLSASKRLWVDSLSSTSMCPGAQLASCARYPPTAPHPTNKTRLPQDGCVGDCEYGETRRRIADHHSTDRRLPTLGMQMVNGKDRLRPSAFWEHRFMLNEKPIQPAGELDSEGHGVRPKVSESVPRMC